MTMERRPHAHLGLQSRSRKALKIERLLDLPDGRERMTLLEIGTGSGGIAHYFATHAERSFDVHAVDVYDSRVVVDGYQFNKVSSTSLPYESRMFDVVISNHVIEHVGLKAEQLHHLKEISRVLKSRGVAYLAVPNRWMLTEPHYRLPFLSWLPTSLRSGYLKLMGKGENYDCVPLELPELEGLLREAGFCFRNVGTRAIREMLEIERPQSWMTSLIRKVPDKWLDLFAPIVPTLIYVLRIEPSEAG